MLTSLPSPLEASQKHAVLRKCTTYSVSMITPTLSPQLLLLTAVKDVAHALQGVIEASTASSGQKDSHPSTQQLRSSTKVLER